MRSAQSRAGPGLVEDWVALEFLRKACTSTAAVHHRPPTSGTPTSRRSMQNGFLSNGCTNSNVYGTTYSTTNGYGNGTLSAKPPLNAARASPRLSQGCGASPRSSVASYSSHTSGIGASPPMARRSPQSNKADKDGFVI
ncbi:hypothetical protein COOONC_03095 [Cooperia oncophora]